MRMDLGLKQTHRIDLQIDHPEVSGLQKDFLAETLESHVLSLIHRWPYERIVPGVEGKVALELGCNVGYGTMIYAQAAHRVIAVDTSPQAIEKARKVNTRENVEYVLLDSWKLPLPDNSADVTVLFQVIEHVALDKLDAFLREIRRVTRQDGQAIFTTPNRKIRLLPFQKPWNTFHEKEYSAQELKRLLTRYFTEVKVEGLFGPELLNEIERRRVRQKPFSVYVKNPFVKYIKTPILRRVPRSLKEQVKKCAPEAAAARRRIPQNMLASVPPLAIANNRAYQYTTADLVLCDDRLDAALDLMATILRVK